METLKRGQKLKLEILSSGKQLEAGLRIALPGSVLDYSCFGLDGQGKLSDERYFIFYNQKISPCGGLALGGNPGEFIVDLTRLPAAIERLVFVVTIDGDGEMREIQSGHWRLNDAQGRRLAEFPLNGQEFGGEKALIAGELYHRDGWRVAAVGQGFNGGLGALLKHFGGEEAGSPAAPVSASSSSSRPPAVPPPLPAAAVVPVKISLEKKLEKAAPHLLSLAKPLKISLEKRRLQETVACVALVLDTSGSMYGQYKNGDVQTVVDRIFPLAVHFDDNGELDTWAFAEKQKALPAVTGLNIRDYITDGSGGWTRWRGDLGRAINNEPSVMREVMERYRNSKLPAYVIFISDGGVSSTGKEIAQLLIEASKLPIFWQFVGIGGSNYGILEKLDTMGGRFVDNCNFFSLDDIRGVSEQELYERLLNEFPQWLKEARARGVLPGAVDS
ncbi:MAG: VWA domain-containing protein [Verrucomicrobiota bacterium]